VPGLQNGIFLSHRNLPEAGAANRCADAENAASLSAFTKEETLRLFDGL
jgi:hypothetical protein